jgi:ubiquinone/menaquinone biosynthesis C-methylase UbiE
VLDVGCGTGVVSREVARRLASFGLVIGFDFSWGALSITKSSVPSGHFVEMDAENIEMRAKNLIEQCASTP